MGEEPYYIDKISEFIEENMLSEEERGFNQMVLYGRDVEIGEIIDNAKRFPMMAERQVIVVKEAQDLSRTIDKLESYSENPQPSTVLVICYKYKNNINNLKNEILGYANNLKSWIIDSIDQRVSEGLTMMNLSSKDQVHELTKMVD